MTEDHELGQKERERLLKQLDKMVESGRVTETEAAQLRTAADPGEFDRAVRAIRVRHERGEHPKSLRAHLRKLLPRTH